ncbi:uncharacterized protein LOC113041217 isoform X2 [Carassius auratus]|uniref:Uncharacterized protein LOC113041217 isoform X2 n=1 Tax=Carassius auratus TaxID=7957 RepID=A0A6P6J5E1_CARAU|nr:uncharacterized protein LOC113041217 isoform X2 [Carassius auratus]
MGRPPILKNNPQPKMGSCCLWKCHSLPEMPELLQRGGANVICASYTMGLMYFEAYFLVCKMSILVWIFIGSLFTVAVCVAELNLEAAEGENVTVSFKTAGLERADQVKITLTRGRQKKLIAQYCCCVHRGDCDVVETAGVLLRVEEGTFSLLSVRSNNTGLYGVIILTGSNVSEKKVTLVVNKPLYSSRRPPRAFTPKPHNFSEHRWLYAAIIIIILGFVSCGVVCCFRKRKRAGM